MRPILSALIAGSAFGAIALPAHAEIRAEREQAALAAAVLGRDAASSIIAPARPAHSAETRRIPGVAQTSVERALTGDRDGLFGAMGFMCGLQPSAARSGSAAITGYDPTGRFVGARLRLAFR